MELVVRKNGLRDGKQMYSVAVLTGKGRGVNILSSCPNMKIANAVKKNVGNLINLIKSETK